eukprot:1161291-Pleurochrysis_carterae.AAC.1
MWNNSSSSRSFERSTSTWLLMSRDSEDKCPGSYLWHNCSIARMTSLLRRSVPSSSELARVLNWAMVSC